VSVRVVPDTSKFKADMVKSLERLERTLSVKIPTQIDFRQVRDDAIRARRIILQELSGIQTWIDMSPDGASLRTTARELDAVAQQRAASFRATVDRASLTRARSTFVDLGRSLGRAASRGVGLTAVVAGLSAVAAGAASAVVPVVQLGAALAPLAGLTAALPAAAAAAGVAMGTLAVATMGVAEAAQAIIGGDADAITEALDALSPAARAVAREFQGLWPELERLQQVAQEELFAPLVGQLEQIGDALLPIVEDGLSQVSAALGTAARGVAAFAQSPAFLAFLPALFDSTAAAITNAAGALPNLLGGLIALGGVGLPYVEQLGAAATAASQKFQDWAIQVSQSGQAADWIDAAIETMAQLGDIAADVGGILSGIFSAAGDGGILGTLETLTAEMDRFVNSAEGVEAIRGIFEGLGDVASALSPVLGALLTGVGALAPAVGRIAQAVGPVLTRAIQGLTPALLALEPGILAIVGALGDAVDVLVESGALEAIGTALSDIMVALAPLLPLLAQLAAVVLVALADVLVALAPHLATLVSELADSLAPVLPEVATAFAELTEALIPLLPPLVDALLPVIQVLPELLVMIAEQTSAWASTLSDMQPVLELVIAGVGWLLAGLADLVIWVLQVASSFFVWVQSARETAEAVGKQVGGMVRDVVGDLRDMRDDAVDAVLDLRDRLVGAAQRIRDRLSDAFSEARSRVFGIVLALARGVQSGIATAVRFVASLPSRIIGFFRNARSWLKNAGISLIYGLLDGLNAAVGRLYDRMARIADNVRSYWPFSPAKQGPLRRYPMDKAGRTIAAMLADGIAQGEHLVAQASNRLAMAAAAPTLAPVVDLESSASTAAADQAATIAALVRAVEQLGGDVVVQVDSEEIARAARRGDRSLARR
jgi:phage-related protein